MLSGHLRQNPSLLGFSSLFARRDRLWAGESSPIGKAATHNHPLRWEDPKSWPLVLAQHCANIVDE